jgi:putative transposase
MARKRFTAEQIVAILREAERATDKAEVFRTHGISDQTYYRWKRMYGGLGVSEVQRIKQLEDENRKLKQLLGEQTLVIDTLKQYQKKRGWL